MLLSIIPYVILKLFYLTLLLVILGYFLLFKVTSPKDIILCYFLLVMNYFTLNHFNLFFLLF